MKKLIDRAASADWAGFLTDMAAAKERGDHSGATFFDSLKKLFPDDMQGLAETFGGEEKLIDAIEKSRGWKQPPHDIPDHL